MVDENLAPVSNWSILAGGKTIFATSTTLIDPVMTIGVIAIPSPTHVISIYQMNAETPQQLQEFCQAACEAANRGGEVLLKWLGKTSPQKKGFVIL